MEFKFIQINCKEENSIDKRQANAVLKYRPDVILLEYPTTAGSYEFRTKSPNITKEIISAIPWTRSDKYMWLNIAKLNKTNHNVVLYAVDGPYNLVNDANIYPSNKQNPNRTMNLYWWVRIYLRERFMAQNIKKILRKYKNKKSLTILVFLQKFHWQHVEFILSHPTKHKIWNFYFGRRFKKLKPTEISDKLRGEAPILYRYWRKYHL